MLHQAGQTRIDQARSALRGALAGMVRAERALHHRHCGETNSEGESHCHSPHSGKWASERSASPGISARTIREFSGS